jgi:hypothetical protein
MKLKIDDESEDTLYDIVINKLKKPWNTCDTIGTILIHNRKQRLRKAKQMTFDGEKIGNDLPMEQIGFLIKGMILEYERKLENETRNSKSI